MEKDKFKEKYIKSRINKLDRKAEKAYRKSITPKPEINAILEYNLRRQKTLHWRYHQTITDLNFLQLFSNLAVEIVAPHRSKYYESNSNLAELSILKVAIKTINEDLNSAMKYRESLIKEGDKDTLAFFITREEKMEFVNAKLKLIDNHIFKLKLENLIPEKAPEAKRKLKI